MKKNLITVKITDKIDTLDKLVLYATERRRGDGHTDGKAFHEGAVKVLTDRFGFGMTDETFWYWREHIRMNLPDIYKKVTLTDLPEVSEHFLHVSREDATKVAYTPDAEKGRRDIQVRTTIGRYAKKFNPDMSDDLVRELSAAYTLKYVPPKVLFALTQDEIEKIYESSPFGSCMKIGNGHIKTDVHPTRCYASGDFAVAYFLNADGKPAARAVCALNEESNPAAGGEYTRIYGDADRMTTLLRDAGFTMDSGAYDGKRLLKLTDSTGEYIAPYVDGDYCDVYDDGDYWVFSSSGEHNVQQASGYIKPAEDLTYIESEGDSVCRGCLDRSYTLARTTPGGCEEYFGDSYSNIYYCESRGEYYYFGGRYGASDFGLVFDGSGDLQESDACVFAVDEEWYLEDDCTQVGKDGDGNPLWVEDGYLRHTPEDFYYNNKTGEVVHNTDYDYEEWEGVDEHDCELYTRYDLILEEVA